ncbi:MAG: hypothetical protein AUH43_08800 [Acidobacteria bacterium 13_1_40CM_65_14]|nr:MAG: hypothetical protein AUH43_08800 [Acidobacteria bacterium 13_1_40CM_65_14]OLE79834.1 MAG: hypothetical protein AUF76_15610 [Acidobacteria bacterium 13_1_20CM_2_65_9]
MTGLSAGDWFVTVTKAAYLDSLAHVTVASQTTADFAIVSQAMTRGPRESEERRHVPALTSPAETRIKR